MQRLPEPELMDDPAQAIAYARADFEAAHSTLVQHFPRVFADLEPPNTVLDLGCGPADISVRFAHMYPSCRIDAVDGAPCMLQQAQACIEAAALQHRITLHLQRLPDCELPEKNYGAIVSNSLLHHLHEPRHLWATICRYASSRTAIFICDLCRPQSIEQAEALVTRYAAGEPDILRRDFYNSLLAAFTPDEVRAQLDTAGLRDLRLEAISDRHLLVYGRLESA
ncbi:MAG: methyltransferase domain-containing protein [Gammaproteobacteria bacterium]|nr:methyltransferase domain-containing protein [Gammaproteobacteria bacterium]